MELHYISQSNLWAMLQGLQEDYSVLLPVKAGETRFYEPFSSLRRQTAGEGTGKAEQSKKTAVIGEVRAFEPLKAFYFQARQKVARDFQDEMPEASHKPLCLVGVKACDLKGFKILDTVFLGADYQDPFYKETRERNLILAADCTSALDVCFCLSLLGKPYPQDDFDINLSEIDGGYVVQAGSEKGKRVLDSYSTYLQGASKEQITARDRQRARVTAQVKRNIQEHGVPMQDSLEGVIRRNFEASLWKEEAATCVECGACNTICPTCHCFLLFDQLNENDLVRYRLWDSCLIKDFAKVAGGANPRPHLWMRLRNRFEKKFDFFPAVNDLYACTGCGRCILACPGKIDIRKVLKRNVENVQK